MYGAAQILELDAKSMGEKKETTEKKMTPFLKWPGGKRWFVGRYLYIIPTQYNHYYEPFLGGGSVFFALMPDKATLADVNGDLINLYTTMRDNPEELKEILIQHNVAHCSAYYYATRAHMPNTKVEQAAQFLYLNRTCYNGMYRVNKQGVFNVPIGTKNDCVYDIDMFSKYSEALQKAEVLTSDFAPIIRRAVKGDLIFADPPYAAANKNTGFIKYNDNLFTWQDQLRLCKELVDAKNRGANIILTNANSKEIKEMYIKNGFFVTDLMRASSISGKTDKRKKVTELLITSFPHRIK